MVYVQSSHAHGGNYQRSIGITLVVLLHVGLFLAISNGLNISGTDEHYPPPKVFVLEARKPEPPIPPVTYKNHFADPTVTQVDRPKVDVEQEHSAQPTSMTASVQRNTVDAPVIQTARVDPRHPLTQPFYPPQSRRMGEQGTVELLLYVLPNGHVGEARIAHSSGYPRLDQAAMREATRHWRFLPNTRNGVAVADWSRIAITFRLKE